MNDKLINPLFIFAFIIAANTTYAVFGTHVIMSFGINKPEVIAVILNNTALTILFIAIVLLCSSNSFKSKGV